MLVLHRQIDDEEISARLRKCGDEEDGSESEMRSALFSCAKRRKIEKKRTQICQCVERWNWSEEPTLCPSFGETKQFRIYAKTLLHLNTIYFIHFILLLDMPTQSFSASLLSISLSFTYTRVYFHSSGFTNCCCMKHNSLWFKTLYSLRRRNSCRPPTEGPDFRGARLFLFLQSTSHVGLCIEPA